MGHHDPAVGTCGVFCDQIATDRGGGPKEVVAKIEMKRMFVCVPHSPPQGVVAGNEMAGRIPGLDDRHDAVLGGHDAKVVPVQRHDEGSEGIFWPLCH